MASKAEIIAATQDVIIITESGGSPEIIDDAQSELIADAGLEHLPTILAEALREFISHTPGSNPRVANAIVRGEANILL